MSAGRRSGRWTSRRTVVLLGITAAALAGLAAAQPWATGTATRAVVGVRNVTGTGGQLAPVVPGLALVGGAAAVAAAVTGRVARRLAVGALALTGLAVVAATLLALHDLPTALGDRAAQLAGSSQRVPMTAAATAWPWVAVGGGVLLALAAGLAWAGLPAWPVPSPRYERPTDAGDARERTLWERVGDEADVDEADGTRGAPDGTAAGPDGPRPARDEVDTRRGATRPDTRSKT